MQRRRGATGLAGVVWISVTLLACGGSSSVTAPSAVSELPPAVVREATNPDPNFDYGLTVQITPAGLRPRTLVASCCRPITWRNLTGGPVSVVFDHQQVSSGPIPPNGTFAFTPTNVESITYRSIGATEARGMVQVNTNIER